MLFVNGRAEVSHTAWFAVNFYSLCFLIGTRNLIRTNTLGKKTKDEGSARHCCPDLSRLMRDFH